MVWTHPRDRKPKPKPPLFNDKHWQQCYLDFIAHLKARNPVATTATGYETWLRQFFKDPDKKPDEYLRQDVEAFLIAQTRFGKPPEAKTRNTKLAALCSFYQFADGYEIKFRGQIKPLMSRKPPTTGINISKTSSRSRAMSDDELKRFFRAIEESDTDPILKKRDRALFLTYLWSGRRRREITELRWRDIEMVKFCDPDGEIRDGWVYHWRGKGHIKIDDSTELPPRAVEAIKAYLEADGRWGNMTPADAIFPGQWPGSTITPDHTNWLYRKYAAAADIADTGIHRFRHTAGRARYEEGRDIEKVQKFLRHSNVATTMIYIQSGKSEADDMAPRLHNRFGNL